MDETPITHPTWRYVVASWIVALLIGAAAGIGLGLLTQDLWVGVIVGAGGAVLIGFSAVLAARRAGRGTVAAAPPWTGDAGNRHHSGGAI